MNIHAVGVQVASAESLRMRGVSRARLRHLVDTKALVVAHRGWYVEATTWDSWYSEARHAAKCVAVVRAMRGGDVVLSHTSAAVMHVLPLYRYHPARVHVTGPGSNGSTRGSATVARHDAVVGADRTEVHGIGVTSLARTVADVVGRLPLATAVALADAAFRRYAWNAERRTYDDAAAESFRAAVMAQPALQRGARASVQARWVVAFADGRSESPGESVSRLRLHQLGFAPPSLQVRVAHDTGYYEVDFGLDDVDVWGEFDGTGKYTDPEMLADKSTAEAVLIEKHREDDIRGRTGRRLIRWGSPHIAEVEDFSGRLASFGIHPPGGPGRVPPTFRGVKL